MFMWDGTCSIITAENQNNRLYSHNTEQDVDCLRAYFCKRYVEGKMLHFDKRFSMNLSSQATNCQTHDARVCLARNGLFLPEKNLARKPFCVSSA